MRAIHSQGLAVVDVVSPSCVLIIGFFWRRASHGRLPVLAKFLYSEYRLPKMISMILRFFRQTR